mmetsp:Transcript_86622/g.140494  ORF Transcript_86622/g.140494 Transcript_86622/m.140494 type:complete len:113 (-) Transcript_86622:52-390(-)
MIPLCLPPRQPPPQRLVALSWAAIGRYLGRTLYKFNSDGALHRMWFGVRIKRISQAEEKKPREERCKTAPARSSRGVKLSLSALTCSVHSHIALVYEYCSENKPCLRTWAKM